MTERISGERWWNRADEDPIHLAAVDWFVRLRDAEVPLEDVLAWQEWLKLDSRHARAFARLEELSHTLSLLNRPRNLPPPRVAGDRYDGSVPLSDWRQPARSRLTLGVAASVALIAVAFVWLMQGAETMPWRVPSEELVTAVGENRTVRLGDGTNVTLGGNTRARVAFSTRERWIALEHGEAFFEVAKDAARPFRVHAGGAAIVAIGTAFNVRLGSDRVIVSVVEGRVRVEPEAKIVPLVLLPEFNARLQPVAVDAGQQITAGDAGIGAAVAIDTPASTTSWQAGHLAFRLQPLRYVLEDVNRYAPKPIRFQDESIGSLVITGTVTPGNLLGWIESLEEAFGLTAVEERDQIVLSRGP